MVIDFKRVSFFFIYLFFLKIFQEESVSMESGKQEMQHKINERKIQTLLQNLEILTRNYNNLEELFERQIIYF